MSLPVSEAPLQLHIQLLYEAWWKRSLQEKEKFGRTAFITSLQKSFVLKKTVSVSSQLPVSQFNVFAKGGGCFLSQSKAIVTAKRGMSHNRL